MSLRSTLRRGANALLARRRGPPTAGRILLYHHVRDDPDPIESVRPADYRDHLGWVREASLRCTAVAELIDAGYAPGLVGLTFDDGRPSALAACREAADAGCSATVFVVPGWIDEGRRDVLAWPDVVDLARSGFEIAAHGLRHESLCRGHIDAMAQALVDARERIEQRIGRPVRGLAYPYGLAPRRAREAARRAGYAYACTSEPGRNDRSTDAMRVRRNEVLGTDGRPELLLGKLAGSDDWMRPVRVLENRWRCGA